MKKRIRLALIALFLLGCGCSCGKTESEPLARQEDTSANEENNVEKDTVCIGISLYSTRNDYMQRFTAAAQSFAKENDIRVEIYDGNFDANSQNRHIKEMINRNLDGILLVPNDSTICVDGVEYAVEADVPIIAVNTRVNTEKTLCFVGSDDVQAGELITRHVAEKIGGKGNVVILEGPLGQSAQIDRLKGIKKVLAEYEGIHVISDKTANWSRLEAFSVMQNWLTTFDRIDAVISENDDMALGALDAIAADEELSGEIPPIVGVDGMEEGLQAVEEGRMLMTLFQDADKQCRTALEVMLSHLRGEETEDNYWIPLEEIHTEKQTEK